MIREIRNIEVTAHALGELFTGTSASLKDADAEETGRWLRSLTENMEAISKEMPALANHFVSIGIAEDEDAGRVLRLIACIACSVAELQQHIKSSVALSSVVPLLTRAATLENYIAVCAAAYAASRTAQRCGEVARKLRAKGKFNE